MNILTITNLYPRPDQPQRGLFNAQFFAALQAETDVEVRTICLVPEWRIWRWKNIRAWSDDSTFYLPVFYIPVIGRNISWWTYGWGMGAESRGARGDGKKILTQRRLFHSSYPLYQHRLEGPDDNDYS